MTLGTGGFININTGNTCLAATGADPIVAWKIGNEVIFALEANQRDVGPIIDWIGLWFSCLHTYFNSE